MDSVMQRAVFLNMSHCFINAVDYAYCQDQIKIFRIPVGFGGCLQYLLRSFWSWHSRSTGHSIYLMPRQEAAEICGRYLYARAGFPWHCRHRGAGLWRLQQIFTAIFHISGGVNQNMAYTFVVLDNRYFGLGNYRPD